MKYIYCHPLFDERKCSHRFSYQLKETFKTDGLILERFDYRGTGEAEGQFENVTIETLRQDLANQIHNERVTLIGVRFGASLAFDYCCHNLTPVRNLILLEPIVMGSEYVDYLHRKQRVKNLMTGQPSSALTDDNFRNLEGYKTSIELIEKIEGLSLITMAENCSVENQVIIVHISNRPNTNPQNTALAKSLDRSAHKTFVENMKFPTFWERLPNTDYTELTQKILGWCHG